MGCLPIAIAFFMPRLILFVGWIIGFFVEAAPWETRMWPILGFFFMPATTLCFGAAHVYDKESFEGIWLICMIIAVIYDIATGTSVNKKSST